MGRVEIEIPSRAVSIRRLRVEEHARPRQRNATRFGSASVFNQDEGIRSNDHAMPSITHPNAQQTHCCGGSYGILLA
jgi:hypothetical protein